MMPAYTFTLVDPRTNHLAFKVVGLDSYTPVSGVQRHNFYTMIVITEGTGTLLANFSEYTFSKNSLLCFGLFQPFQIDLSKCKGYVVNFHPDFFCIHKHHNDVACHGVLFNNIYDPPFHELDENSVRKLLQVVKDMQEELQQEALAQTELLVSYLKIFLITASRSKASVSPVSTEEPEEDPFVLQKLKDAIEAHYREKHAAGEYASMLNISAKALAKLTKNHFKKTLTDMIAERIVMEAKRDLYLTSKPVKAIAFELGFDDAYHFSRFFKNRVDVSPQTYRNKVGFARAEEQGSAA